MAKSKALLAAEAKIAALEAQLVLGRRLYAELKASKAVPHRRENTATTTYWKDASGQVWEKTRNGARSTSRPVRSSAAIESIAS